MVKLRVSNRPMNGERLMLSQRYDVLPFRLLRDHPSADACNTFCAQSSIHDWLRCVYSENSENSISL